MINKMCNAECGKSFWNKQNENFRNKLQAKIILKKKKEKYIQPICTWNVFDSLTTNNYKLKQCYNTIFIMIS